MYAEVKILFYFYSDKLVIAPSVAKTGQRGRCIVSKEGLWNGILVALWATLAALVAGSITPRLWWVGLLVGGSVAYITTDFQHTCSAAIKAWNSTTSFRADRTWWRTRSQVVFYSFNGLLTFAPVVFLPFTPLLLEKNAQPLALITIFLGFYCLAALVLSCLFASMVIYPPEAQHKPWSRVVLKGNFLCIYARFAAYCFNAAKGTIIAIAKTMFLLYKAIPVFLSFVWRFTIVFLKLIHSQKRVIRAGDTVLAAALAYLFVGSPGMILAAAILGFVIGIFHFEYISVRLLKVVPRGTNA